MEAFANPQDKADLILAHICDAIPFTAFNYVSVGRKMDEALLSTADKADGIAEVPEHIPALEVLLKQPELVPRIRSRLFEFERLQDWWRRKSDAYPRTTHVVSHASLAGTVSIVERGSGRAQGPFDFVEHKNGE
jgi:hypothetical protein